MKYYTFVIGCQMNYSDAERLESILKSYSWQKTKKEKEADLIIVVSCSVRQKAMDRIYGQLNKWQKLKDKKVKTLLTGCVLPDDQKKLKENFDYLLDIRDIENMPKLLGLPDKKWNVKVISGNADYLEFKPNYSSKFQAYIPIMTGCNNFCTYCAVPYTRGAESSRPSSQIINEAEELIKNGYKEITLLGQNVNAYLDPEKIHKRKILDCRSRKFWKFRKNQPVHKRIATTNLPKDFATLLKKINSIPGNFWIRFISSNPQDISEELINTLPACSKVTRYFHFALQSGDDEILRKMNRRYTSSEYLELVKKIREKWPGVAISTDIIVGFPGETDKQFQNTINIMNKIKFDMAYIAEYSPRPGTAAQRFFKDNVLKKIKSQRKQKLNQLLKKHALEINKRMVGKTYPVLVEKYQPKTSENFGRTESFKNVKFKGKNLAGNFTRVKIIKAGPWGLFGRLA